MHFDAGLMAAVAAGAAQVVLLAAGLDARAWRLPLGDATVYEVDQALTFAYKDPRLPGTRCRRVAVAAVSVRVRFFRRRPNAPPRARTFATRGGRTRSSTRASIRQSRPACSPRVC